MIRCAVRNGHPTEHLLTLPIVEHVGVHRFEGAEVWSRVRYDGRLIDDMPMPRKPAPIKGVRF